MRFLLTAYLRRRTPSTSDVDQLIPNLHGSRDLLLDPLINQWLAVKTHFCLSEAHPWIDHTERAIYLLRDPRDVLYSCLALQRALETQAYRSLTDDAYAELFIKNLGDPAFRRSGYGTWPRHVRSWTREARFPVLVLRYEDLCDRPLLELERVVAFLGLPIDHRAIEDAVRECSIANMRSLEEHTKRRDQLEARDAVLHGSRQAFHRGHRFIGNGAVGTARARMSPGLARAFHAAFGDALNETAYESPPADRPLRDRP